MEKDSLKHVLLRYSDNLAPHEGVIFHHNQVIKEHGFVWMGKFGKPVSDSKLDILKRQIEDKKPAYVFLVKKDNKEYSVIAGEIESFSKTLTKEELNKVPAYYREKSRNVGIWFKIKRFHPLDNSILNKIFISSSGASALQTLPYSMAGYFLVKLESHTSIKDFKKS